MIITHDWSFLLLRTFMDCHCPSFGQRACSAVGRELDGREAHVLRANQLLRAVYAEPGQHVILFCFRQRGLTAGMLISALTLAVVLGVHLKKPQLN